MEPAAAAVKRLSLGGQLRPPYVDIEISPPVRIGEGLNAHNVYTITAKNTETDATVTASRRFSDFVWLHSYLSKNGPGYIIPPLPDRHSGPLPDAEFLARRREGLIAFAGRLMAHTVLRESEAVRHFFEDDAAAFAEIKQQTKEKLTTEGVKAAGSTWWGKTVQRLVENDTVKAVAAKAGRDYQIEKSTADVEFSKCLAYVDQLINQMKALHGRAFNLQKACLAASAGWTEVAASLAWLQQLETQNEDMRDVKINGIEPYLLAKARVSEREIKGFSDALGEYIRYLGAVKDCLLVREDRRFLFQSSLSNLERLESSGKVGEAAVASDRAQTLKNEFDMIHKRVMNEFIAFLKEKPAEIRGIILDFAKLQLELESELAFGRNSMLSNLNYTTQGAEGGTATAIAAIPAARPEPPFKSSGNLNPFAVGTNPSAPKQEQEKKSSNLVPPTQTAIASSIPQRGSNEADNLAGTNPFIGAVEAAPAVAVGITPTDSTREMLQMLPEAMLVSSADSSRGQHQMTRPSAPPPSERGNKEGPYSEVAL